jgi:hypothetical protein
MYNVNDNVHAHTCMNSIICSQYCNSITNLWDSVRSLMHLSSFVITTNKRKKYNSLCPFNLWRVEEERKKTILYQSQRSPGQFEPKPKHTTPPPHSPLLLSPPRVTLFSLTFQATSKATTQVEVVKSLLFFFISGFLKTSDVCLEKQKTRSAYTIL